MEAAFIGKELATLALFFPVGSVFISSLPVLKITNPAFDFKRYRLL